MGGKGVGVMPEPANADAAHHMTIIRQAAGDWLLRLYGSDGSTALEFPTLEELLQHIPAVITARKLEA